MKIPAMLAAMLLVSACATEPQEASKAAAKPACTPPPTDLVVRDLEPGKGDAARFRSAVLVNYTGWLYDPCKPDHKGAMFDTSKGKPVPFGFMVGAGRVIKGWDQGVVGMKEGGKRLLVIPPQMGYGGQGVGAIPPNSTLVFEVDLVKIIQQPPQ